MKKRAIEGQLSLFGEDECAAPPAVVEPAKVDLSTQALAQRLPWSVWLGTSSWSFPGWSGLVYAREYSEARLAKEGLRAYAQHPLLRAVGLDRTYYAAVTRSVYRSYAAQVCESFRFLVKAPESLVVPVFPHHPRWGERAGQNNPHFLCSETAWSQWVEPASLGLMHKLGCLLLQFPPLQVRDVGGPATFAARLYEFLDRLPRGLPYAVELRNRELFTQPYREGLARLGAHHCLNVHPQMLEFEKQMPPHDDNDFAVVRWMLNPRLGKYEEAVRQLAPFHRLGAEDAPQREAIARFCRERALRNQVTLVIVNNKAEGCSPLSLRKLAEAIVAHQSEGPEGFR